MKASRKNHYTKEEKINRLLAYTTLDYDGAYAIANALVGSTFETIKQVVKQLRVFGKGK